MLQGINTAGNMGIGKSWADGSRAASFSALFSCGSGLTSNFEL